MYTTIDTFPAFASRAAATFERVESAIYRADAWYQAEVLPLAAHSLIVSAHLFVQAVVHTYAAGVRTRRWVDAYNEASVPAVETEVIEVPQLALPAAPEQLALPAAILPHPDHERIMRRVAKAVAMPITGDAVRVTPAPVAPKKQRTTTTTKTPKAEPKTASPAPRKRATTVKAKSGAQIPID